MLLLLMFACDDTTTTSGSTCALGVPTISPASAAPGEQVILTSERLTDVWDTVITVGSARATLVDLDRSTCTDCDDCQDTGGCSVCEPCDSCDTVCATCVETVTFTVPSLEPGEWPVEVVNRHGRSERVSLTIVAAGDDTATSTP